MCVVFILLITLTIWISLNLTIPSCGKFSSSCTDICHLYSSTRFTDYAHKPVLYLNIRSCSASCTLSTISVLIQLSIQSINIEKNKIYCENSCDSFGHVVNHFFYTPGCSLVCDHCLSCRGPVGAVAMYEEL